MTTSSERAARPLVSKPARSTSWSLRRLGSLVWDNGLSLLVLFFVMFPIFWLTLTAFKQEQDVYTTKIFFEPTLANFIAIFTPPYNYGRLVLNSFVVSTLTVLVAIPLALMAAYVFSRFAFRGSQILLLSVLVTQFIPPVVVVLPFFTLFRTLNLLDTYLALVIVYLSIVLPYSIWMLKGFVDALPVEIEEAATVDGCTTFQVLRHVTFPLTLPGVITTLVFAFIMCWNEFLFALILTRTDTRTLQLGLLGTLGVRGVLWELMAATGLIVMIPVFILSLTIRKHFVEGLTMGAVK